MDAIKFKGSTFTLMILQIFDQDLQQIELDLEKMLTQSKQFFQSAPVVISPQNSVLELKNWLVSLVNLLQTYQIYPVGIVLPDPTKEQKEITQLLKIAIFNKEKLSPPPDKQTLPANKESNKTPSSEPTTKITPHAIRSGQQIYAKNGDIIALKSVNEGAEVIADHDIHIYGTLKGRAAAGANGNTHARIFCQSLEAQLISIAGIYKPKDEIMQEIKAYKNKPIQIYLRKDKLIIEPLQETNA